LTTPLRPLLALVAASALWLAGAAPGYGYSIGGPAWPGGTVSYYTAARGYSTAVDRAAGILNRAGIGVHLSKASRANADVIVAYGGRACEGDALVGFSRSPSDVVYLGRGCSRGLVTLTAVHELGHVLGLDHENRRCARMNPSFDGSGTPNRCRRQTLAHWLAHPLTADDVRGLRAIYGG
jgi:hypothetical protein